MRKKKIVMPDPLHRGRNWGHNVSYRPMVEQLKPEIRNGKLPIEKKTDFHSVAAQEFQQKRIASRVSKKGMWDSFKKYMRDEYGSDDKWLENKAGSIKAMVNELGNIKNFVDKIRDAGDSDINVDNMLREVHASIIKALTEVSKKNELNLNEGSFRNFLAHKIPSLDPRRGEIEAADAPPEMEDDIIKDSERLIAWLQ